MKVFRYLNSILDEILVACFLIVFLCGLYGLVDSLSIYEHASSRSIRHIDPEPEEIAQGEESVEMPEGRIGWLTIAGTQIDYPVMQGKDNQFYLNHDSDGEYSISGSIFLDYRNPPDFSDECNVIYGHHMAHERMFGQLDDFLDETFFSQHETGILDTGNMKYTIRFIGCFQTTSDDPVVYDVRQTSVSSVLHKVEECASDKRITGKENHLVMMSTCRDTVSNIRTVLVGNLERME